MTLHVCMCMCMCTGMCVCEYVCTQCVRELCVYRYVHVFVDRYVHDTVTVTVGMCVCVCV